MSQDANTDRPQLKLVKRHLPLSVRNEDEFEFDFDFGEQEDSKLPTLQDFDDEIREIENFNSLLSAQSKTIKRIKYFVDELEFNLD